MMHAPRIPKSGPPPNSSYSNRVLSRFKLAATLSPAVARGGPGGHEPGELFPESREQELDRSFAGFQKDVADKAIADDDPHVPFVNIATLDIPDKAGGPRTILIQGSRRASQLVPLFILGAHVHEPNAGVGHAQDRLGVNRPHDAVLVEVFGLGVHVGADVDDHDRPLVGREDRGNAGPADAGEEHAWR